MGVEDDRHRPLRPAHTVVDAVVTVDDAGPALLGERRRQPVADLVDVGNLPLLGLLELAVPSAELAGQAALLTAEVAEPGPARPGPRAWRVASTSTRESAAARRWILSQPNPATAASRAADAEGRRGRSPGRHDRSGHPHGSIIPHTGLPRGWAELRREAHARLPLASRRPGLLSIGDEGHLPWGKEMPSSTVRRSAPRTCAARGVPPTSGAPRPGRRRSAGSAHRYRTTRAGSRH